MAAENNDDLDVPETHVLAIASHVTSGYVGNTMATFCMQTLGCEVSAIHTVNYSNHVGYRTFTGRPSTPSEVAAIYTGLETAHLASFDVLLSGYCPSAALVHQVDAIGQAQRRRARDAGTGTGTGFFWVCDPVMGDNGRLYVAAETVPAYRDVVRRADLVLPNQFEAELLSGVEIVDGRSLREAVGVLHGDLGVPHVVVTSLRLGGGEGEEKEEEGGGPMLSVVGSTATAEGTPRLFRIQVQAMPVFFSGTGDMFAALLVGRLREAALRAGVLDRVSWMSPDGVAPTELPLAKATAKVLASMGAVLKDTERHYRVVKKAVEEEEEEREREKENGRGGGVDAAQEWEKEKHLRLTRAAEVRVVRNARALREPPNVEAYAAAEVD